MPTNTDPAIYDLPSRALPPDLEWLDEFVCEGLIVEVRPRHVGSGVVEATDHIELVVDPRGLFNASTEF